MAREEGKKAARHAAAEHGNGCVCERTNGVNDMLGAARTMPASAFQPESAGEYEDQVGGLYSNDD
jgi:hypothetical protein